MITQVVRAVIYGLGRGRSRDQIPSGEIWRVKKTDEFNMLMTLLFNRGIPCSIIEVEAMTTSHKSELGRSKKKQIGDSLISANLVQDQVPSSDCNLPLTDNRIYDYLRLSFLGSVSNLLLDLA